MVRSNVNSHEMETVPLRGSNGQELRQDVIGIQCLYIDDTDLLWVGTEKAGLAYYGDNIYKFKSEMMGDITAIAQDKEGKIWYGTGDKGLIGRSVGQPKSVVHDHHQ